MKQKFYETEDVIPLSGHVNENGYLYEFLFDTRKTSGMDEVYDDTSYELILEFIYRIKKELGTMSENISLKKFFEHLNTSTAYKDILIKKQLESLQLIVADNSDSIEVTTTYSLTLNQFYSKQLPKNISFNGKIIKIVFNGKPVFEGFFKDVNVFESIESIILSKIGL